MKTKINIEIEYGSKSQVTYLWPYLNAMLYTLVQSAKVSHKKNAVKVLSLEHTEDVIETLDKHSKEKSDGGKILHNPPNKKSKNK